MTTENIEKLERTILLEVPQLPLVLQHLEVAMKLAKEGKTEEDYAKALQLAYDLLTYAKQGGGDYFFKYYILTIALLDGIDNVTETKEFETLETASGKIKSGLEALEVIKKTDSYKVLIGALVKLAQMNVDAFAIQIKKIVNSLRAGVSKEELLGYAYVVVNLNNSFTPPSLAVGFYKELQYFIGGAKF